MRDHDVSSLTAGELERARRGLAASLALAGPGSLASVPIPAHLSAVDAELAERTAGIRLCSCGLCVITTSQGIGPRTPGPAKAL